jgi:hypothetical protein
MSPGTASYIRLAAALAHQVTCVGLISTPQTGHAHLARPPNFKQDKKRREEAQKKRNQEKQQERASRRGVPLDPLDPPKSPT